MSFQLDSGTLDLMLRVLRSLHSCSWPAEVRRGGPLRSAHCLADDLRVVQVEGLDASSLIGNLRLALLLFALPTILILLHCLLILSRLD